MTSISITSHPNYMSRAEFGQMAREAGSTPMGLPPAEELYPNKKNASEEGESAGSGNNGLNSLASTLWNLDYSESADPAQVKASEGPSTDQLLEELQKWTKLTPGEFIRAKALEEMGISEEKLAQMPAEERQAIEEKIAELVKQALGLDGQKAGNETQEQLPTA